MVKLWPRQSILSFPGVASRKWPDKASLTIAINTTGPYGAAAVQIILVVPQNGTLHIFYDEEPSLVQMFAF